MTSEDQLLERLKLIEALHSGAATAGEREAAASARDRIRARLQAMQVVDPPMEYTFTMRDQWKKRLLVALLRRYNIRPYRYTRQRYTTVMAKVPKRFVDETLWPEFLEYSKTLDKFLEEVTQRVIVETIEADTSEPEVRSDPQALPPAVSREF